MRKDTWTFTVYGMFILFKQILDTLYCIFIQIVISFFAAYFFLHFFVSCEFLPFFHLEKTL